MYLLHFSSSILYEFRVESVTLENREPGLVIMFWPGNYKVQSVAVEVAVVSHVTQTMPDGRVATESPEACCGDDEDKCKHNEAKPMTDSPWVSCSYASYQ
ncbi:hypothetical protein FPSE_00314 [Fusarium pseudograminearum CS3096]|uniref:Uncharacterized protein n=1 Tax=Fusarium pseudograminearum (strain CS3096) TaxID=1028729 RepID=K3W3J2_FUSPC|nr:hypothetical protein FPSE_00314 [Fusarium pseudograminearum CS3096]EKJ79495.1 hypothetical protein FPSE_00314 [Fusarium pseudograminearum CS3096]